MTGDPARQQAMPIKPERAGVRWPERPIACIAVATAIFCLAHVPSSAQAQAEDQCAVLARRVAAARQSQDLAGLVATYKEIDGASAHCEPKVQFCLGRSVALGHVAAAYARAKADAGTTADGQAKTRDAMETLLTEGRRYGAPWQLLVGLADIELDRAKSTHDGAVYAAAANDYQLAMFDIEDESVCRDYGEPPEATTAQIREIYARMSTALMLASPVRVATTKCSPCRWAFLAGVRGFTPPVRPLPITFDSNASRPSATGLQAVAALLECLKAQNLPRVVLSGHTDEVGSASSNMVLSSERLKAVELLLRDGGYAGEMVLEPKGQSEPYPATGGYSRDEIRRLNRRIELRSFATGEAPSCAP